MKINRARWAVWLIFCAGYVLFVVGCGSGIVAEPPPLPLQIDSGNALAAVTMVATQTATPPTATVALPTATVALPTSTPPFVQQQVLGTSTNGYPIDAWVIGNGNRRLVLIGGIHGGYEWNTVLLAYRMLDHFEQNPAALPRNVQLIIIPVANPDGLVAVTGKPGRFDSADVRDERVVGRFNGNQVDLNRNWDCQWQQQATWSVRTVSGGTAPFSEIETVVLRDYLAKVAPQLVIFYHSAADGVYTGQCGAEQHPDTLTFSAVYANAANYALHSTFAAYTVTGDASDYLNRVGTASFTVELTDAASIEWEQNWAGVQLMIKRISEATER